MRTTVTIPTPALWSPASPNLYDLTLAVGQESSYSARVGLRQLTWHSNQMLINGTRLALHGASIQEDVRGHGDALTPTDQPFVRRCSGCHFGRCGWRMRRMSDSASSLLPFRTLHGRQAQTTFSHVDFPPREMGTTWSSDSSDDENFLPQY